MSLQYISVEQICRKDAMRISAAAHSCVAAIPIWLRNSCPAADDASQMSQKTGCRREITVPGRTVNERAFDGWSVRTGIAGDR